MPGWPKQGLNAENGVFLRVFPVTWPFGRPSGAAPGDHPVLAIDIGMHGHLRKTGGPEKRRDGGPLLMADLHEEAPAGGRCAPAPAAMAR
jgi:hypothetical protein